MAGLTKKKAQQHHARRRAAERYFLELTPSVRAELIGAIQSGRSTPLGRTSNRASKHRVKLHDGLTVTVIYDRLRKEIVTLLPNRGLDIELRGPRTWGRTHG